METQIDNLELFQGKNFEFKDSLENKRTKHLLTFD